MTWTDDLSHVGVIDLCDYRLWSWDFAGSSVLIPRRPEVTGHRNCLLCWKSLLEDGWICLFFMRFQFVNVHERRPADTGGFDGKKLFQACLIWGWALKHWMLHVGHDQWFRAESPWLDLSDCVGVMGWMQENPITGLNIDFFFPLFSFYFP